jgi:diguanylate cyclase (GGDEF)-like protein/PAS domain S-box-containing protein
MTDANLNHSWKLMVEALPEGAVLTDARRPDHPVLYANPAFERITGYAVSELTGRSLRLLHRDATDQPGLRRLREAVEAGLEDRAVVQNFRKNGEPFWMDVHVVPVRDAEGVLTHWVSVHREAEGRPAASDHATGRFRAMSPDLVQRVDPSTGLRNRLAFEELLAHHLAVAVREGHALTLFMVRIDDFERYVETFDRSAGEALMKRVGLALAGCFRRGSDALARHDEDSFAVLTTSMDAAQRQSYGQLVCARVADLRIHHPHSRYRRYVTLSVGAVGGRPARDATLEQLIQKSRDALEEARATGDTAISREIQPVKD